MKTNSKKQSTSRNKMFAILDDMARTQFVETATSAQRLAILPFVRRATLYAFDEYENPLPANAETVAAERALSEHRAAIRDGRVSIVSGKAKGARWLAALRRGGEAVTEKLEGLAPEYASEEEEVPGEGAAISPNAATVVEAPSIATLAEGELANPTPANATPTNTEREAPSITTPAEGEHADPTPANATPASAESEAPSNAISAEGEHADPTPANTPSKTEKLALEAEPQVPEVIAPNHPADPNLSNWQPPNELAEAYGPEFPVHCLSASHQRFVEELAEQVQIPVDVPALASLGMIGAAAARTIVVRIQSGDEHPTNFWALIISPPGDGKTPLLLELRRPFDQVQDALRAAQSADEVRAATELRIRKLELTRVVRDAASTESADEREELTARAVELTNQVTTQRSGCSTLLTGDCTQMGLLKLMASNAGRLLLLTDEGDQLFSRVQQRSPKGAEDIDDMLKAYSGATIDRHDAQRELRIPGAALSIVATTQPRPFAKVMGIEAYHSKGFIARFAVALPRSIQGARKQRRAAVSDEARASYHDLISGLLARQVPIAPQALGLSEEAFRAFAECGEEADRELTTNRDASFRSWLGKLRGLTARLAGILHISDPANNTVDVISGETMERAVQIGRYLTEHARVAYEHSERAALDEDPRRLLRWIRSGERREFTHAEAVVSFSGRLHAREVQACIERLVVANVLREKPAPKSRGGRPRKPSYLVNPHVFRC